MVLSPVTESYSIYSFKDKPLLHYISKLQQSFDVNNNMCYVDIYL